MKFKIGDYVCATKYSDGDPRDQFCIGSYNGITAPHYDPPRHDIVDGSGNLFRGNGFRRVRRIRPDVGKKLVDNLKIIEGGSRSLWSWVRQFEREKIKK